MDFVYGEKKCLPSIPVLVPTLFAGHKKHLWLQRQLAVLRSRAMKKPKELKILKRQQQNRRKQKYNPQKLLEVDAKRRFIIGTC